MARFSTLFTDVLSQAQDCPKVVAMGEIRKAAIDLCERSAVWTRNHQPVYAYKDGEEYEMDDTPTEAVVDRLLDAMLDGKPLRIGGPRDLFELSGGGGPPSVCAVVRPGVISLAPVPQERHVLVLRVAYKPSRRADEMDDAVLEQWRDTIIHGALYRLKMMVDKPWTDPQAAAVHKSFCEEGIRQAKVKAITGYGVASRQVRSRSFG